MRTAAILCTSLLLLTGTPGLSGSAAGQDGIRFRFDDVSLRSAVDSLMRWYPVSIVFLDRDVEGKKVKASCTGCTFEQALDHLLAGSSLTWMRIGNQVILKPVMDEPPRPLATLSGTIADSLTGELLAGVHLVMRGGEPEVVRWCPSNAYGFFSFPRLQPGRYTLTARAVGYRPATRSLVIRAGGPVQQDVILAQEEIALQEVTVEGHRSVLSSTHGYSHGVYFPASMSDPTQYLLDGARIHNPSHVGGVISTFNEDVLSDVEVAPTGIPPYYGGRIGGVLDLSMREGTRERLSGMAGTGSLGTQLSLEGPVADGTTFLLSGRRSFPEMLVPRLAANGSPTVQGSTELIAKVSHRLSGSSRLFLSGYLARDAYSNAVLTAPASPAQQLNNNFSWGNSAVNLRWIGIASSSTFLHASAVYSRYSFSLEHRVSGDPYWIPAMGGLPGTAALKSQYAIEDISLRGHAEHYYDDEHTVRGGVELVHHRIGAEISEFSTQTAPFSLRELSCWEMSVYLQDQWRISSGLTAELGARATNFTAGSVSFSGVDPRFSLLIAPHARTRFFGSLTAVNEFLHPYRNSGVFLLYPALFWYPSSDRARPSGAMQVSIGAEHGFAVAGDPDDETYRASASAFYRSTQNEHEFLQDTALSRPHDLSLVTLSGKGRSYGLSLALHKRRGTLTGSLTYALSWARNTFDELNGGRPFEPRLNRRNEIRLAIAFMPSETWTFAAVCAATWDRINVGTGKTAGPAQVNDERGALGDGAFGVVGQAALVSDVDLNGSRLPGFQRLELSATRTFVAWSIPCRLQVKLLNGYGLLDPFEWGILRSPRLTSKWSAYVRDIGLLPLYPTLGLTVRF